MNPGGRKGPATPKHRSGLHRPRGGRGPFNGHATLTEVDGLTIRARAKAGERQGAIASDYGIHSRCRVKHRASPQLGVP